MVINGLCDLCVAAADVMRWGCGSVVVVMVVFIDRNGNENNDGKFSFVPLTDIGLDLQCQQASNPAPYANHRDPSDI